MSDTPRTDAETISVMLETVVNATWLQQRGVAVSVDFSRQLERELNTAHADGAKLSEALRETTARLEQANQQLKKLLWF